MGEYQQRGGAGPRPGEDLDELSRDPRDELQPPQVVALYVAHLAVVRVVAEQAVAQIVQVEVLRRPVGPILGRKVMPE